MRNLNLKVLPFFFFGCAFFLSSCSKNNEAQLPVTLPVVVSTFAGGTQGSADGTGTTAELNNPTGVTADATGNLYVADFDNNLIRKITPAGVVTTIAGNGTFGSANGIGTAATFGLPLGIAIDGSGNLYVSDVDDRAIRKITPDGVVSTFAGSGTDGTADGTGTAASFKLPGPIAIDATGNLYVIDYGRLRKITQAGVVTTIMGTGSVNPSTVNFTFAGAVAIDAQGNLYVSDGANYMIKKITLGGVLSTFAGSGTKGLSDGTSQTASFTEITGMTMDAHGNLFASDSHQIRMVSPAGTVTTIAGTDALGDLDGPGNMATFLGPDGMVVTGNALYVADTGNNSIRKITY